MSFESPQSPTINLSDQIKNLRNELKSLNNRIQKCRTDNKNNNAQDCDLLDEIDYIKEQIIKKSKLLNIKIEKFKNHELNTIHPQTKRKRSPSPSASRSKRLGGTKKHRRKSVRRNRRH
jgi:septal ring factor EnvC (AmiA/AmiB activator)